MASPRTLTICPCVAVTTDLPELDRRVSDIITCAWSANTLSVRNSQWKLFLQFCSDRGLVPIPVEISTVVRFLAFLEARKYKYSTINNYLSAVISLQKFYGFSGELRSCYLIHMVLSGLRNRLGNCSTPKRPLSVNQLQSIYNVYPKNSLNDVCWLAMMICFRTLLRKSNVVPDSLTSHTLLRKDVRFFPDYVEFSVATTKTRKKGEEVLVIPVYRTSNRPFCVYQLLYEHFLLFPASPDSPLLMKGSQPLMYRDVLKFMKNCVCLIGIQKESVGLHSLRRSGAMYLQSIGIPLYEIQLLGDWRSMAVLYYLSSNFDRKVHVQRIVISSLEKL